MTVLKHDEELKANDGNTDLSCGGHSDSISNHDSFRSFFDRIAKNPAIKIQIFCFERGLTLDKDKHGYSVRFVVEGETPALEVRSYHSSWFATEHPETLLEILQTPVSERYIDRTIQFLSKTHRFDVASVCWVEKTV